jgi:hypothetical protein
LVLAAGLAPALSTLSTSCLCVGLREQDENGASRRCCPGATFLQRKPAGCRKEAKWSQSRVLPSAELAYETGLSAGSIAYGAPTRICTEFTRLPSKRITGNALRALKMVGARRLARPRLPDSESGGSAFPREPRADEIGVPDRLRSGDLLHERQACWTGLHHRDRNGESRKICTFDLMHVTHPLWLAELCSQKWRG